MGIKTGIVVGQEIKEYRGSQTPVRVLNVQLLGESPEQVVWLNVVGDDTAPVNGDEVVVFEVAKNYKVTLGTKDQIVAAVASGEKKLYSRNADGNVISSIYLKDDGTIEAESFDSDQKLVSLVHLKNDASILLKNNEANGDPLSSVELKTDGTIQADTEVDLIANVGRNLTATVLGDTTIDSTGNITSTAPKWIHNGDFEVNGNTEMNGTLTVSGIIKSLVDIIADHAATAISLLTHFAQGNLGFPTGTPIQSGGGSTPGSLPSADASGEITDGLGTKSTNHTHPVTSAPGTTGIAS